MHGSRVRFPVQPYIFSFPVTDLVPCHALELTGERPARDEPGLGSLEGQRPLRREECNGSGRGYRPG